MCQNIEDFNQGCTLILARLYQTFPRPLPLDMDRLDTDPLPPDAPANRFLERNTVYGATLEFLADEGYLKFVSKAGPEHARVFSGVRLTSKGLAALNRVPPALRPPSRTLGDQMIEWGRGALSDVGKEALKQGVSLMLGGA